MNNEHWLWQGVQGIQAIQLSIEVEQYIYIYIRSRALRHEGRGWYGMLYSSGRTRGQHSGKEKKKKWLLGHHHLFSRSLLQKHDQHCTATIFPVHQEVHAKEGKLAGRYTEGRRASRRLSQPSSTKFVLFFCISFFLSFHCGSHIRSQPDRFTVVPIG